MHSTAEPPSAGAASAPGAARSSLLEPSLGPVVLVSVRGPVVQPGLGADASGSGGLLAGLRGIPAVEDVAVWLCAGQEDADPRAAVALRGAGVRAHDRARPIPVRALALDRRTRSAAVDAAASSLLWFLHHELPAPALSRDEQVQALHAYAALNRRFGEAVVEELDRVGEHGVVMLHDFQLLLVAAEVRARRPQAFLHHFVHVPWPSPRTWRELPSPWAERLLRGVLANDVVAFHTQEYVSSFLRCCEDVPGARVDRLRGTVGLDGRSVAVRAYPLSPEPSAVVRLAGRPEVVEARARLQRCRQGKLVVRVDRADPTKNILLGLDAWDLMLRRHPEHVGAATFRLVVQPTRQSVGVYQQHLQHVRERVAELDATWSTTTWRSVDLVLSEGPVEPVAALQEYDVLLVNALRDGMNLVAKEGPLLNDRDGVVVLSRRTGAHAELGPWVIGVDPRDVVEQAEALHRALTLPRSERAAMLRGARAFLQQHDGSRWYAEQQRDIAALRAGRLQ